MVTSTLSMGENLYELLALLLVIVAWILAKSAQSPMATYLVMFLAGVLFGRLAWQSHKKSKLPLLLLLAAFVVGFFFGVTTGNSSLQLILLVIGIYYGHQAHDQKFWPFA